MEIHQLRYFVAIADTGSFSRAAAECRVAQPSLSQQIIKLERELGQRLFDRLGRTTALTEAGRELLPHARRILAEVQAIESQSPNTFDPTGGRISVGAIPTIAPYLLPGTIHRLMGDYPNAQVTVREDITANLVHAVAHAELDVCIISLPVEDDRLTYETILTEPLVAALPPDHDLRGDEHDHRVPIQQLDGQPAIVLHELHCLADQVRAFCRRHHVTQRIVCRTTQLSTVTNLVALGMGISIVPQMVALSDRTPTCIYRPLADAHWRRTVVAVRHVRRSKSRLFDPLVEAARAQWAAMQGTASNEKASPARVKSG